MERLQTMVRWSDGFVGGLIAGVTSAAFYVVVARVLGDPTLDRFLTDVVLTIPALHGAGDTWPVFGLGVVLYLLACGVFGIIYALLARGLRTMWRAPGSVAWGLVYGLAVFWALDIVLVAVTNARSVQPFWVGLVGSMVFYGVALSEWTTMARRHRAALAAAAAPASFVLP